MVKYFKPLDKILEEIFITSCWLSAQSTHRRARNHPALLENYYQWNKFYWCFQVHLHSCPCQTDHFLPYIPMYQWCHSMLQTQRIYMQHVIQSMDLNFWNITVKLMDSCSFALSKMAATTHMWPFKKVEQSILHYSFL